MGQENMGRQHGLGCSNLPSIFAQLGNSGSGSKLLLNTLPKRLCLLIPGRVTSLRDQVSILVRYPALTEQ